MIGIRVSVCVPTFNGAAYIRETVSSVLDQTLDDFEIVVVDQGSTDGTEAAVAEFCDPRLRLVRNLGRDGAAGNWNRAVQETRGRFVKLLCHDDTLAPQCLAHQVAVLEAHPEVALVAGQRDIIDEKGRVLLAARGLGGLRGVVDGPRAIRATVRAGTNIFGEPGSVMMRRELIPSCGPFSAQRPYVIDLDYWCRMLRFGPLFALAESIATFRVACTSWSVQLSRMQSSQTIELFKELRMKDPCIVHRYDFIVGVLRAKVLASLRATAYRVLNRRERKATPVD